MDIKLEGVEKTIANLKKWQLVKREAVAGVGQAVGFKIERQAKEGCPVWTGRLRNSMSTNWSGSGMDRGRVGGDAKANDGVGQPEGEKGLVTVVGTNVSYAHMQEFGSWGDGPKPTGEAIAMPTRKHEPTPRPEGGFQMLTKAYLAHENEYVKRIEDAIGKDEHIG
jgi:phage gpG-like protein